jgi:Tn3 transposase DDE domain
MARSRQFDPTLLQHVSPLGWDHINLTGDYTWHTNKRVAKGGCHAALKSRKTHYDAKILHSNRGIQGAFVLGKVLGHSEKLSLRGDGLIQSRR